MSFNDASIPSFEEPASEAVPPVTLPVNPLVAGIALGTLLLLVLAAAFFRRRANKRREMLLAIEADEEALRRAQEEKAEKKQIVLDEPQPGYRSVIKQISKDKPTEVVEVLKVWLRE